VVLSARSDRSISHARKKNLSARGGKKMVDRLNIITKNIFLLLFWLFLDFLSFFIHLIVVIANYMGTLAAFELLGFEMRPLETDSLLGPYLGAFLGNATMAHFYALAIALTVALAQFLVYHSTFRVFDLSRDRRTYIQRGDEESAGIALRLILFELGILFFFVLLLGIAVIFDVELFRYRFIAGALSIDDPTVATKSILSWSLQVKENFHLYAWHIARIGAWGYLSVTALACLMLGFLMHKTGDAWTRLLSGFQEMSRSQDAPDYGHEYVDEAHPTYEEDFPLHAQEEKFPFEGSTLDTEDDQIPHEWPDPEPIDVHRTGKATEGRSRRSEPEDTVNNNEQTRGNDDNQFVPEQQGNRNSGYGAADAEELFEVIGSRKGERVTLRQALRRKNLHVDMARREVWDRKWWEIIHGTNEKAEAA